MNHSRAGTPTPGNVPGVDKRIDDKMGILLEQQMALEEALTHYMEKMDKDDFWKPWYENAYEHYARKLDKVNAEIKNTSGYKDEAKQTKETPKQEVPAVKSNKP